MAHGGRGGQQPSCTTVSFGKAFRRAFRAATGIKKKPKKVPAAPNVPVPTMERVSSFSSESSGTKAESVVRVVLRSGVVEAYPGVVLACTVIENHPPGLCLAHPDVFRNPHGAVVRPLEPLFPGQKFLLLPESTVIHLKQKIPESSIGAFFSDDDDKDEKEEEEQSDRDYNSGTTTASSSEEEVDERDKAVGDEDGGFMAGCCARDFYEEEDRWSRCQFKKLVKRGLAVERATDDHQREMNNNDIKVVKKKKGQKKKRRKGKTKKRKDHRRVTAPPGFRNLMVPRRMWEPSLPSVLEEEETCASSQQHTPSQATTPEITSSK